MLCEEPEECRSLESWRPELCGNHARKQSLRSHKKAQHKQSRREAERWAASRWSTHGDSFYRKPKREEECRWGPYYCLAEEATKQVKRLRAVRALEDL